MPNFSIALTGLQADSVALNTIGNNLANLNTTAFKEQSTTFEDLFYQNIGSNGSKDSLQVGVGTKVSGTTSNFSQGSLVTDNTATDIGLNGNGFFLVQQGGQQLLTRAGNFQLDASGNLITQSGENVLGYGATGGKVNLSGALSGIQLPLGATEPAQATQNISLQTSLDASAATGTQVTAPIALFDSLGVNHAATVSYTKTSPTTWDYSVTLPSGDATGTPVNSTGTLTFDASGKLVTPAANVAGVTFPGMADGAKDLAFNFNLYNAAGAAQVTQTAGASNTSTTSQDGFAAGTYQSFTVDHDGVVSAEFSNGQTTNVGQIAVATVQNVDGLTRAGSNDYATTDASGLISVGQATAGGRAALEGESLEQSNVDISSEVSNVIVAQRAFEANSKAVTTFDTVTQDAIAMVR